MRSALVDRDGSQVRLDYLRDAWEGPPAGTLGHWAARAPEAAAEPDAAPLNPDELLALLESLGEAADASNDRQARVRYTLALLLLARGSGRTDGGPATRRTAACWSSPGRAGRGPFEVPDLALPEDEIGGLEAGLPGLIRERAD